MPRHFLIAAASMAAVTSASADSATEPATYAIVVGSNRGGPGQTDLGYAEQDARRMGAILNELGGVPMSSVEVVLDPTPDELRSRLARLATRVASDRTAGRQSRVVFYYSGHARSTALDLGASPLSLGELRGRLFSIPSTLTIVVLDACQSGAFSQIKGAAPAADFSFNSRQQLEASGVAILASSTGSELSQESAELGSSYFTHHLLVGMRGAAVGRRRARLQPDRHLGARDGVGTVAVRLDDDERACDRSHRANVWAWRAAESVRPGRWGSCDDSQPLH